MFSPVETFIIIILYYFGQWWPLLSLFHIISASGDLYYHYFILFWPVVTFSITISNYFWPVVTFTIGMIQVCPFKIIFKNIIPVVTFQIGYIKNCPHPDILKMNAHFETDRTKGNRHFCLNPTGRNQPIYDNTR